MKALLLIAHGSRSLESNEEICELCNALRTLMANSQGKDFDMVECAYLELTKPDIETAIAVLVRDGAMTISVLPYFLAKGNHVNNDIPEIVAVAQNQYPDIKMNIVPHIGKAANMLKLLLEHLHFYSKEPLNKP